MELEEAKKIFKESIDEAETPIDLFRIILEKTYEKGVEDGNSKQAQYGQKKGHDMEPSKDEIIKATRIIRTGMTTNDIDADDFNWAIHILQRAFRNGYSVVKTN